MIRWPLRDAGSGSPRRGSDVDPRGFGVGAGPLALPGSDVLVPPCLSADAELEVSATLAEPEDLDLRSSTAGVKERRVLDRALGDEVVVLLLERGAPSGVDRATGTDEDHDHGSDDRRRFSAHAALTPRVVINGTGPGALRGMSDARAPEVVSARVHVLAPLGHPMLASLPRLIRASPSPAVRSFERALHSLREEQASRKLGRDFAVTRLLEVLFVHALRAHIEDVGWTDQGWFRMLADPVLREPLAEASRPKSTVGGLRGGRRQVPSADLCAVHPARGRASSAFLRQTRVRHAAQLLRAGESDLDRIATASGYASRQGLCRAFRREIGVTPAAHWRAVHGRPFPRPPRRPC